METKYVRVPFDIEMAKKITNGEVEGKVVTRDDGNARIICWDAEGDQPIIALIKYHDKEYPHSFCLNGLLQDGDCLNGDLMLKIPEYMTFKDGDVIAFGNEYTFIGIFKSSWTYNEYHSDYIVLNHKNRLMFDGDALTYKNSRFATEEEKQTLIDALKESKDPKAKEYLKRFFGIDEKQEYKFTPKDWILCRCGKHEWTLCQFSHINKRTNQFVSVNGLFWDIAIPYNDQTKHLLGTNDNWEE